MEDTFRSFYKTVEGGEGDRCNYRTRLDMYGRGCQHNCAYCVHPDTPVLMYNGTQKPIKDVQIGDEIYGYTEDNKLVRNIVLNKWNTHKKAYKITLQDGTELICSGDHRWLSNRGWKYTTGSMSGGNQRPYLITGDSIIRADIDNDSETIGNKIVSIEPLGEMDLIDITTQTENFIADGCVSHNCYARYLLDFRGNWNNESPAIADRKEVLKTLDTIPEGSFLRLGGMTDPFQPIESQYHHTEWLIGELNDRNINYLIVTKGALVADCKEISPKLGHVQMSITHTHEPPIKDFEQASPWEDRLKAIETINDRGIDAQIRLSPMIPGFIDPDIILASKVDKVLVEFLRVNTFIKRNMRSQFKPWTEQSGAYYHLPLGKKITMLKPYFGKKRLTICEDHPEHYEYFLHNINANPADCCDLRINED